jgi:hypothetical protein
MPGLVPVLNGLSGVPVGLFDAFTAGRDMNIAKALDDARIRRRRYDRLQDVHRKADNFYNCKWEKM